VYDSGSTEDTVAIANGTCANVVVRPSIARQSLFGGNEAEHKNWAQSYLVPPVLKVLREERGRQVLDLGCGNGSFSAVLQSHGFSVLGCDASVSGIALARQANPGIDFLEHDITNQLRRSI